MSLYALTTVLAAGLAAAQCSGDTCMDNGMGSMMSTGSSSSGCMMTQWMTSGGSWQTVSEPQSYSSNPSPQVWNVTVGGSAGLVYSPSSVTANVGDIIQFNFQSMNHTATQSGFDTPCVAMDGGVQSGFMPNPDDTSPPPAMQMQVTVSTPLWFYCQQTGHCGQGMVFSVNPTADKTQDMFVSMAEQQNGTSTDTTSAAPPPPSSSVVSGTGTTESDGSCSCQCLCGTNDYASGLGVGAVGGYGGMLSVSSMAPPPSTMGYVPPPAPSMSSGMMSSDMSSGGYVPPSYVPPSSSMASGMSSGMTSDMTSSDMSSSYCPPGSTC